VCLFFLQGHSGHSVPLVREASSHGGPVGCGEKPVCGIAGCVFIVTRVIHASRFCQFHGHVKAIASQDGRCALLGVQIANSRKLFDLMELSGRDRVFAFATGRDRSGMAFPRILEILLICTIYCPTCPKGVEVLTRRSR